MYQRVSLLFLSLLCVSINAGANQYNTDYLNIDVKAESFSAAVLNFDSGGVTWNYGAPYAILADGVKFSPGQQISTGGAPELVGEKALMFNVSDLRFTARQGYKITGYEFSFSGQFLTSNPASIEIRGKLMGDIYPDPLSFDGDHGWTPYAFSTTIAADNPRGGAVSADGWFSALALPIHDYFIDDSTGTIVEYVSGAGRADITLDSLSIRALISPVPEPATWLMFLAGLGLITWRAQRNRPSPGAEIKEAQALPSLS